MGQKTMRVSASIAALTVVTISATSIQNAHAFISWGLYKNPVAKWNQRSPFITMVNSVHSSNGIPSPINNNGGGDNRNGEAKTEYGSISSVWQTPYSNLFHEIMSKSHAATNIIHHPCDHNAINKLGHLHVILFNEGSAAEGVHTIEYPKHSGCNIILAFESLQDCEMFGENLRIQMGLNPTPQKVPMDNLESYAVDLGMSIQVIPTGMKLKPPPSIDSRVNQGLEDQFPTLKLLKEKKMELDKLLSVSKIKSKNYVTNRGISDDFFASEESLVFRFDDFGELSAWG